MKFHGGIFFVLDTIVILVQLSKQEQRVRLLLVFPYCVRDQVLYSHKIMDRTE